MNRISKKGIILKLLQAPSWPTLNPSLKFESLMPCSKFPLWSTKKGKGTSRYQAGLKRAPTFTLVVGVLSTDLDMLVSTCIYFIYILQFDFQQCLEKKFQGSIEHLPIYLDATRDRGRDFSFCNTSQMLMGSALQRSLFLLISVFPALYHKINNKKLIIFPIYTEL